LISFVLLLVFFLETLAERKGGGERERKREIYVTGFVRDWEETEIRAG
jgi:hypothetical protein